MERVPRPERLDASRAPGAPIAEGNRFDAGASPDADSRRRRRRGRRGRGGFDRPESPVMTPSNHAPEPSESAGPLEENSRPPRRGLDRERTAGGSTTVAERPGLSPEELAAEGRRLTEELLQHMGFEATVQSKAEENRVDVTVMLTTGEDLLTGRKGEVRQAIQHLLTLMINRGRPDRYHLQLEVNDFWQRREEELRDLARRLAEDALARGTEAVTEYLNAQERRVIHVVLRDDTRVKTYALGTGLIKRVAVAPADFEGRTDDE
jgi:spoIIIJ-associated protein